MSVNRNGSDIMEAKFYGEKGFRFFSEHTATQLSELHNTIATIVSAATRVDSPLLPHLFSANLHTVTQSASVHAGNIPNSSGTHCLLTSGSVPQSHVALCNTGPFISTHGM